MRWQARNHGIFAALLSALSMGCLPIFGKQTLLLGFTPLAVVATRTSIAAVLMLAIMLATKRQFFYIYPVGLIGCFLAGFVNGIGSIMYYFALERLSASIGHLLYSFYPVFVALWLLIDRQSINRITALRLLIAIPGVYFLITGGMQNGAYVDLLGAGLMIVSAMLYALHLLINQRVLYEVPAPTVTLYTLLSMSVTVVVAFLLFRPSLPSNPEPWLPLLAMAGFTFFSRLTLFTGVKHLGGMQTAILGLGEIIITVTLAQVWLGERLNPIQWIGTALLAASLLLVGLDKYTPEKRKTTGWLSWLNPPRISPTDYL